MKQLKSYEIRKMWLDFFKSKGHDVIPSASLIPINDPTLLWINAGIAPLKKYFDGREIPTNRRMTNSQKAIRTNDIENVGKTARHHTFFEMLGNFSIGDYFRDEVLPWAFELLTSKEYFDIDVDKLYFTIYPDDEETFNLWKKLGVKESHIVKLKDNFWEIGEGPCGPDTEIFFDRGEEYDPDHLGEKLLFDDIENDRYIEIWNIVFSQFNSTKGLDRKDYPLLPNKNIDTGCGLERLACIMQHTKTNYETDLFMPIIKETERITKVKYEGQMAFKVIADHIRSVTFALSDGANLSNEGRGYVLRRLLRRAVRYGRKLGMNCSFLYELVETVSNNMIDYYPYLQSTKEKVKEAIKKEEEKFLATLDKGEKKLHEYMSLSNDDTLDGETAFLLYDTFGFPFELTKEICEEKGFKVSEDDFQKELSKQKERARNARSKAGSMGSQKEEMMAFKKSSTFIGYELSETESKVIGLFKDGIETNEASGEVLCIFDKTVFFAESGGQIGDEGIIAINDNNYNVLGTYKMPNMQNALLVDMKNDTIRLDDKVYQQINVERREAIAKNHSGTHLLNEALRCVLGSHIHQLGSYVGSDSLHFDFNNFKTPTQEELIKVENLVNEVINKAYKVEIKEMPIEEAKKTGAQMVFGDKYSDIVRVVNMDFSKEFCGGCHVSNTKDIEKFVIFSIENKGSGIYRVEASTSNMIKKKMEGYLSPLLSEFNELNNKKNHLLEEAKKIGLNLSFNEIKLNNLGDSYLKVVKTKEELLLLKEKVKELEKTYNKLRKENITIDIEKYLEQSIVIDNYNIIITKLEGLDNDKVKDVVDRLTDRIENGLVFVANENQGKVIFVCKNKIEKLNAGLLVKEASSICLGGGGGRCDFAQAGGKDPSKIDIALNKIREIIKDTL